MRVCLSQQFFKGTKLKNPTVWASLLQNSNNGFKLVSPATVSLLQTYHPHKKRPFENTNPFMSLFGLYIYNDIA